MSSTDTASITCTRQRDSSAEFSSNDGFSVVAPTNRIVPRSICGRNASCCALLKRCTSSTNSTVRRPSAKRCAGFGQDLAHFRQAGQDGGDRAEFGVGIFRQQQRERGLAATGRPPQDHRMHVPGFDRAPQRGTRREQPALADHFVERARAHALGERTQGVAIDAQQIAWTIDGGMTLRRATNGLAAGSRRHHITTGALRAVRSAHGDGVSQVRAARRRVRNRPGASRRWQRDRKCPGRVIAARAFGGELGDAVRLETAITGVAADHARPHPCRTSDRLLREFGGESCDRPARPAAWPTALSQRRARACSATKVSRRDFRRSGCSVSYSAWKRIGIQGWSPSSRTRPRPSSAMSRRLTRLLSIVPSLNWTLARRTGSQARRSLRPRPHR